MKKIFLAMIAFFALVYVVVINNFPDVQINKYKNAEVVHENNVTEKGWIPAILPDSAYDISETHDLDTNEIFGSFYYKQKDEPAFLEHLTVYEDINNTLVWENFLFKVDQEQNKVKYRNKPVQK
jgi:hypothetical protein